MMTESIEKLLQPKLHIPKKKTVTVLVTALLLLSLFTPPTAGCPPQCPPCYYWDGSDCVYGCYPNRCEVCKNGICQSKCDSDNCMVCNGSGSCVSACYSPGCLECDGHGFCESSCDPNLCEECDGQGNCVDRCDTNECRQCDGQGSCTYQCDEDQCLECDGQGNCESWCDALQCLECDGQGNCPVCGGDPDKCCDNGTCVDKCTNTAQCDYGELPGGPYVECYNHPVTGKCEELEGGLCFHVTTIAQSDAQCADCEPGCDKTRISACIEIIPYYCTTHCFFTVCSCQCDPNTNDASYRGDHYECD